MTTASVSTHVLDTTTGKPATGLRVALSGPSGDVATLMTDADGRVTGFPALAPGRYALRIVTADYFPDGLYPEVTIAFTATGGHLHLPLLLSPFAYSTYRGS